MQVMIFDFDVHHGNGTNDIFYDDPDVLFISTHQVCISSHADPKVKNLLALTLHVTSPS